MKSYSHSILSAILVTVLLPACFPVLQLYKGASADFSTGAAKEMKGVLTGRFDSAPVDAVPTLDQIIPKEESGEESTLSYMDLYQGALEKINKALKKKGVLQENDVLGNALVVKALAAWKLKRYEEAESAAVEAQEIFKTQNENSPRDEVLSQAIPGLITLDMVYDSTLGIIEKLESITNTASDLSQSEAKALFEEFQTAYADCIQDEGPNARSLLTAFTRLDGIVDNANAEKKSIAQFVVLSELTGLKNWYDALFHIDNVMKLSQLKRNDDEVKAWINAERKKYDAKRTEMLSQLLEMLDGSEDHPTYQYWDFKL